MKMIGPHKKCGPKIHPLREVLAIDYGLSAKQLSNLNLDQLAACKDDAAVRILLGVTR